ncbi:MAG: aminotransferase class IV [Thermoleophilia bacterium]
MGLGQAGQVGGAAMERAASTPMLYLDGTVMPLESGRVGVEDRGFQLGDGVYEVVKVYGGRLLWLEDHLERLAWSIEQILLPEALVDHQLSAVLPTLVSSSGVTEGTAYVQVTRGVAPREFALPVGAPATVLAYVRGQVFPGAAEILAGIYLHAVQDQRWARCDIKSTNLLPAVLAKEAARKAGAHEAMYVSPEGIVREGGSSNVFLVMDGVLHTHPANNRILNGITRCHALEAARALGLTVVEEGVPFEDLHRVEEMFIASTTRDIMPVVRVGGLGLSDSPVGGGVPGPVTLALVDAMRERVARAVGGVPPPPLLAHS